MSRWPDQIHKRFLELKRDQTPLNLSYKLSNKQLRAYVRSQVQNEKNA